MDNREDIGCDMQASTANVEVVVRTILDQREVEEQEPLAAKDSITNECTDTNMNLEASSPAEKPDGFEGSMSESFVGMVFQSSVAAYRFYMQYAEHVGFGVRKKLCRRSKTNNEMIAGWYVCSREGKHVVSEKTDSPQSSLRTCCPAALKVKRMADKEWKVIHFVKEHNHQLDQENTHSFQRHMRNRVQRTNTTYKKVEMNHKNTNLCDEQLNQKDGDCSNFMDKGQRRFFTSGDAQAIHMLFMSMHSKNPAFFYAVEFDGEQHLKNAFWVDAKAKLAYMHFGDVVTFDTTHLKKGYKVPFASFVGVNHHGQSILFGYTLLADTSTASLVWLFRTWLEAMSGRTPNAIITDYSKGIAAAVVQVFPKTHHRFCLRHILQQVPEKLVDVCEARENFFKKFYKCIFDSMTDNEFEKRWWKLIQRFGLGNEEWLQSLYKDKEQWVPLYLKGTFYAGLSISERDDNINTIFDKHITGETKLKDFLAKYELALESKFEDEAEEDFRSSHSKPKVRIHPSPFELQLTNVYTRNMFERFQTEVLGIASVYASISEVNGEVATYKVKAYEVQEEKKNRRVIEKEYMVVWNAAERKICCVCHLFEFKGYLCRHTLAVFLALGVLEIPNHYILKRWTRDAKNRHVLDEGCSVHGDRMNPVAQRFNDMCLRSFKFAEEASLSQRSYDVAVLTLNEVSRKIVQANNNCNLGWKER